MSTLSWGTVGYVKYYFVSRQGGFKDGGTGMDTEHRPCYTVAEVQKVIRRHEDDAKWLGHMAHLSIETCIEVPGVGQFWSEDFRPEWTPGTTLYRVWQCYWCDARHPRYQWSAKLFARQLTQYKYMCRSCGYDPADDVM